MRKANPWILLGLLAGTAAAFAGQNFSNEEQTVVPAQAKITQAFDESPHLARDLAELQGILLKLKAESGALATEQDIAKKLSGTDVNGESAETIKLRLRLGELMTKLGKRGEGKKGGDPRGSVPLPLPGGIETNAKNDLYTQKPAAEKESNKSSGSESSEVGGAADPRALAHVLFKAANYELALKAYRLVNLTGMKADERAPLQYLMATCLKKMGKTEEAAALYRDVANVRGDEQVASCAQWQLVQLRWTADFEAQLKDLQERRKALETSP
jgi:TolA-binding protein